MKTMQQLIAEADAVLNQVDASMVIFDRLVAAKRAAESDCVWCGGPCVCETWDDDLAAALIESELACQASPRRCLGCADALTLTDGAYCPACSEWGTVAA